MLVELLIHAPATLAPRSLKFDPPLTDDEMLRFCRLNELFRIERTREGVIEMMAPAATRTGSGNANISGQLFKWWDTHRRGEVFDSSAGYTLPDGSMLSPDASYLTEETMAGVPESEWEQFAHVCPDFVIELMSKSDRLPRMQKKMTRWMENGVKLAWLVQPANKRVLIYEHIAAEPVEKCGEYVEGSGPVEGFRLQLGEVWQRYSSSRATKR